MGNDRSKRGRIVSIEVLRRLAAIKSGSSGSPASSSTPPLLPDEEQLNDAIDLLEEDLRNAYRFGPRDRERLLARLRADLEKLPEVRSDKVIEAKQRISSGYYDNDAVRREILRSILESIIPPHILEDTPRDGADELHRMAESMPDAGHDVSAAEVRAGQEGEELERLQRRRHFRMAVQFPMAVTARMRLPMEAQAGGADTDVSPGEQDSAGGQSPDSGNRPGGASDDGPGTEGHSADGRNIVRAFRLLDLSAGGCLCEDPDVFLQIGEVYEVSLQLNDKDRSLDLHARVVRRAGGRAGLSFEDMTDRDSERIMRSLFREYRRRRSSETRCDGAD